MRGFTDSDWAGDVATRRSTSGGLIFTGRHAIALYSKLQARVALSSCEAEVNGIVKCTIEGLHLQAIAQAFGEALKLHVFTDASAARGEMLRSGAGKMKRLAVTQLWTRELLGRNKLQLTKVHREHNPSDVLTHAWVRKDVHHFVAAGFAFYPWSRGDTRSTTGRRTYEGGSR